ncbi:MAG TPA: hypothetical protein DEP72_01810 [Clostridiales bacterium]|nr:MAG: hypothetical protein A2Y18_07725 [Clostridiales bacterium GWD2_32_19]HCC06890.1 hypothetical protein [Clostridiales bacterium]
MYDNYTSNNKPINPEANTMDLNRDYADMLMNIYAGEVSELTLVMQYMYHLNFYEDVNKDLAEDVEEIHVDDMEHMHILADLIITLGGDPEYKYSNHKSEYWSAKLVDYKKNICDMLKSDMSLKKAGIDGYRKLISEIADTRIKTILTTILRAEIMHYNILENYYKRFCISYRAMENDNNVLGVNKELPIENDFDMEDEDFEPLFMGDNYENNISPNMNVRGAYQNNVSPNMDVRGAYENNVSPNMDVRGAYENNVSPNMDVRGAYQNNVSPNMDVRGAYQNNVSPNMDVSGAYQNNVSPNMDVSGAYQNNVSPNMDVRGAYENDEMLPENDLYMPDEYEEDIFCEKGKHFITEDNMCGYDCEFGCGCNEDCINCNGRREPYKTAVSAFNLDDDDKDDFSGCRSCRPRLRSRRYM